MKKLSLILAIVCLAGISFAAPTIDGVLDASGYTNLASALPGDKTGFGGAIDCSGIWWQGDATNIYLFVQCKANTTNSDGILLLINSSKLTGAAAGTSLGNIASGGAVFGNTGNNDWKMEFEVDMALFGNTGSSATNYWVDFANYVGSPTGAYFGNPGQSGTPLTNLGFTMAFNNAGNTGGAGSSTGWELEIPRASLGNLAYTDTLQGFAIVTASSAWFSDDSAPANIAGGNPGPNPDFGSISGTQYVSTTTVPVALDWSIVE